MTESSILLTIRLGQEAYDALAIFLLKSTGIKGVDLLN